MVDSYIELKHNFHQNHNSILLTSNLEALIDPSLNSSFNSFDSNCEGPVRSILTYYQSKHPQAVLKIDININFI